MTFESFNYLSSTRIYNSVNKISVGSNHAKDPSIILDIYDASKLTGEALCLSSSKPNVKVTRVSHVVNPNDTGRVNFLPDICAQASKGKIILSSSLFSKKNYILINDLNYLLTSIGPFGKDQIYNAAAGTLISHKTIIEKLKKLTNCEVVVKSNPIDLSEKKIGIDSLKSEFKFKPTPHRYWLESVLSQLSNVC